MKKKKIRDFFDDDDFFFDFDKVEKMMDDMMKSMIDNRSHFESKENKPIVMGFSMKIGPDGKPIVKEFGHMPTEKTKRRISNFREPLTDVREMKNNYIITLELPGVEKKDIDVSVKNEKLVISTKAPNKFRKELFLEEIDDKKIKANLKNGILEISVPKKKNSGKKIQIK